MTRRILALAAVLLAAAPAAGQRTISPGMTEDQVRTILGAPATSRATEGWTYLYYHNGCPIRCGSDDVVFLRDGRVVAAVFRTGARRFAGPAPDDALERAGGDEGSAAIRAGTPPEEPAVVGGVRVRTGEERDRPAADDQRGRTVISRPSADGQGGTVIIRREGDDPRAPAPVRRVGSREASAAPVGARGSATLDAAVQDTLRRRTTQSGAPETTPGVTTAAPPDTARVITPRGIPPRLPRDTTRQRDP